MKRLTEAQALTLLGRRKAAYQTEIKLGYEHRALACRNCPTPGVCCTDAHFVNIHITRLEAVHLRETLRRTPRLDAVAQRQVYERAREAIERYNLTASGDTFRQTYSCPLFQPGAGCLVHGRAKPAPCVQHACYDDWEDLPPANLQWRAESRVEKLNTQVYGRAWAWLPTPVWLTLVDPDADQRELDRLACLWSARRETLGNNAPPITQHVRHRSLPVIGWVAR